MFEQQFRQNCDIRRHLPMMKAQARGNVLELGVRGGSSTAAFLAAAEEGRVDRLWSVDVNDCGGIWAHGHRSWTFIQSDSVDRRRIEHLAKHQGHRLPGAFDVLFIDTSHTYPQTLMELTTWGPLVKPDGLILLHDAYTQGVQDAVEEWTKTMGFRYSLRVGSWGMFVIWPRSGTSVT
jgi:predicted O-methyltransferase YrrM